MLLYEIVRKAWPDASDDVCEHVLWARTPFPCGAISARSLYQAASTLRRAVSNGKRLCDFCDNAVGKAIGGHVLAAMRCCDRRQICPNRKSKRSGTMKAELTWSPPAPASMIPGPCAIDGADLREQLIRTVDALLSYAEIHGASEIKIRVIK